MIRIPLYLRKKKKKKFLIKKNKKSKKIKNHLKYMIFNIKVINNEV